MIRCLSPLTFRSLRCQMPRCCALTDDIIGSRSRCRRKRQQHTLGAWWSSEASTKTQEFRYFTSNAANNASDTTTMGVIPLTQALDDRIGQGSWQSDPIQRQTAAKLERLQTILKGYSNRPMIEYQEHQRLLWELDQREKEESDRGEESGTATATTEWPSNKTRNMDTGTERMSKHCAEKESESEKESEQQLPPPPSPPRIPRGLYIHGSVGIGKSVLMDLFFEHVQVEHKQRFHFHAFMTHVHCLIHQLKQEQLKSEGRSFSVNVDPNRNPIRRVAHEWLAPNMSLLCLDEFQVTDIVDAVILSQLFSTLWSLGTVVVATSNQLPSQLYKDGLNRSYFLPFIDLLEKHCLVHTMQSDLDYRIALSSLLTTGSERFFFPSSHDNRNSELSPGGPLEEMIQTLRQGRTVVPVTLEIAYGRRLLVERGDEERYLAQFHFSELCEVELGPSDYRALARQFDIIAIQDIPKLSLLQERDANRARRFVTLMDELYESKSTALMCSTTAAAATAADMGSSHQNNNTVNPRDIFQGLAVVVPEKVQGEEEEPRDEGVTFLGIDQAVNPHGHAMGALANVRDLSYAFDRAASRIVEMTSRRWWDRVLLKKKKHP